jgi:predicted ATPase
MSRFVILSGCSGGGKSTLLQALAERGFTVVPEPGRRIVAAELTGAGAALPWIDPAAFARRAMALALDDLAAHRDAPGWVVFDRGLVDAAAALEHATGASAAEIVRTSPPLYRTVFLTPPWPEIYVADRERRHGFEEAVAEYERLAALYPALGFQVVVLPKASVAERVDLVEQTLAVSF